MTQDPSERKARRHEGRRTAAGQADRIRAAAAAQLDAALGELERLPATAPALARSRLLMVVARSMRLLEIVGPAAPAEAPTPIHEFAPGWRPGKAPRLTLRERRALGQEA